jgi:hypothetical protein
MTASSRFAKSSERAANQLWNVSLLPLAPANETGSTRPELRKLENVDERRSKGDFLRPLRVSWLRSSDILD